MKLDLAELEIAAEMYTEKYIAYDGGIGQKPREDT